MPKIIPKHCNGTAKRMRTEWEKTLVLRRPGIERINLWIMQMPLMSPASEAIFLPLPLRSKRISEIGVSNWPQFTRIAAPTDGQCGNDWRDHPAHLPCACAAVSPGPLADRRTPCANGSTSARQSHFLRRLRCRLPVRYGHFDLQQQVDHLLRLVLFASSHMLSLSSVSLLHWHISSRALQRIFYPLIGLGISVPVEMLVFDQNLT